MRRAILLCILAVWLGPLPSLGQDSVSQAKLQELKQATVFVRVDGFGAAGSGTGFLLAKVENRGYIVTNSHVVSHKGVAASIVEVVFHSGTRNQLPLSAEIVGNDPDVDLAILSVESNKLPAPIRSGENVAVAETMPVYILGFPFGEGLATVGRNPGITVSVGRVSSIRQDALGRTVSLQIDGNINPGNSGGPIVNQEGVLVGIAVAKLSGTSIGFAIPELELRSMLLGRMYDVTFRRLSADDSGVKLEARGRVIDPLRRLQGVSLHFLPLSQLKEKPKVSDSGEWSLVSSEVQTVATTIADSEFQGEVHLRQATKGKSLYVVQPSFKRGDGKTVFGAPALIDVLLISPMATSLSKGDAEPPAATRPRPKLPDETWITKPPEVVKDYTTLTEEDAFFYHPPGTVVSIDRSILHAEGKPLGTDTPLVAQRLKIARGETLPHAVWSADGERLYLATAKGTVRSIKLPQFIEERRLELGGALLYFGQSSEGLVAVLRTSNHVVVIDPETLATKRHIHVPSIDTVACTGASPRAYVLPTALAKEMLVIDLARGRLVNRITAEEIAPPVPEGSPRLFVNLMQLSLTPDGSALIVAGESALHRLAIANDTVVYEDSSLMIGAHQYSRWSISPDSQFLVYLANSTLHFPNYPRYEHGAYVFPLANLKAPSASVPIPWEVRAVALDTNRRRAYTLSGGGHVGIHELAGEAARSYPLEDRVTQGSGIFLSPDGKGILVVLTTWSYWIALPAR